jgi:hypothetical protein
MEVGNEIIIEKAEFSFFSSNRKISVSTKPSVKSCFGEMTREIKKKNNS